MATQTQKKIIFDTIEYSPTSAQAPIHESLARIILVAGGERSGKSRLSSSEFLARLFEGKLFWLVGENYEQTRPEFDYICDGLDKLGIQFRATKRVDPGTVEGIDVPFRIDTKSARDPRKLAMQAPDGILGCEAAQLDYETFLRLMGRVAEKRGWLILSGTFEGSLGWYPEMFTRWSAPNEDDAEAFSMPTWSNTAIFPLGEQDPEILRLKTVATSKEYYLERYGGKPCPPAGRVFTEFSNAVHTGLGEEFEFDPAQTVYLAVDPGYAFAYAVEVIQKRGEHIFVVDEIYERGLTTSDIIKVCRQRPWWNKITGGAIDVAGLQHQAMPAVSEVWMKEAGIHLRSRKIQVRDGIERLKGYLQVSPLSNRPLLHINTRCKGLISEMGGCANPITNQTAVWRWRQDREGVVIGDQPEDRNNHATKALYYLLIDLTGYSTGLLPHKTIVKFF